MNDRIDDYIRGTMSEQDRLLFEEELRTDEALREEFEITRSMVTGIQAVGLKRFLEKEEASIKASEAFGRKVAHNSEGRNPALLRRIASLAACFIILFAGFSHFKLQNRIQTVGSNCYAELVTPSARGGGDLDSLLASCYDLIGRKDITGALDALSQAQGIISEGLNAPVIDEETEYNHTLLQEKMYEADWYELIIIMKQGKYSKAKAVLKQIAASDSPYADKAKIILDKMFNIKPVQK